MRLYQPASAVEVDSPDLTRSVMSVPVDRVADIIRALSAFPESPPKTGDDAKNVGLLVPEIICPFDLSGTVEPGDSMGNRGFSVSSGETTDNF